MTQIILQNTGIDISKATLDVALYPDDAYKQFENSPKGYKALIDWLSDIPVERIVFEATGIYHRALEKYLLSHGLPAAKVNPKQARRFAEASGTLAKTDRVDARMLARFGALLKPLPCQLKSEALEQLGDLVSARKALIKDRTSALNRQKNRTSKLLLRQGKQNIKQIDNHIADIDKECLRLVKGDETLKKRHAILNSIPGLGDITTLALIVHMPELGHMNEKQVASLAGLAPVTRQSGQWHGKAFIKGGRSAVREALFMPVLVAIRHNKPFADKYKSLLKAGKMKKVAITAIMRKMLILANALLRDQRMWQENTACS